MKKKLKVNGNYFPGEEAQIGTMSSLPKLRLHKLKCREINLQPSK